MKRINLPFAFENGQIACCEGSQAGQQAVEALLAINPGELPLSRRFGAPMDYNITLETAQAQRFRLLNALTEYHPMIGVSAVQPVLSRDGTVADWELKLDVG